MQTKYFTLSFFVALFLATTADAQIFQRKDVSCTKDDSRRVFCVDAISGTPLDGTIEEYFPNGSIQTQTSWQNGRLNGFSREYDATGSVIVKNSWEDGYLNGAFEEYYNNGKLKARAVFQHGKLIEEIKHYDQDGNRIAADRNADSRLR